MSKNTIKTFSYEGNRAKIKVNPNELIISSYDYLMRKFNCGSEILLYVNSMVLPPHSSWLDHTIQIQDVIEIRPINANNGRYLTLDVVYGNDQFTYQTLENKTIREIIQDICENMQLHGKFYFKIDDRLLYENEVISEVYQEDTIFELILEIINEENLITDKYVPIMMAPTDVTKTFKIKFLEIREFDVELSMIRTILDNKNTVHSLLENYYEEILKINYRLKPENQIWFIGTLKFSDEKEMENNEKIENYEQHYNISFISVKLKISLNICYGESEYKIENILTNEKVSDIKSKMVQNHNLLISNQEQTWYYEENELKDDYTLEQTPLKFAEEPIPIEMKRLVDFEFIGFSKIEKIKKAIFKKFHIESEEDTQQIVQKLDFNDKLDNKADLFRMNIIGLFFNRIKKHCLWEGLIDEIIQCVVREHKQKIWTSPTPSRKTKFNTQFLLNYFLNSGSSGLNTLLLKAIQLHLPIPLAIKTWEERFNIIGQKQMDEIYWNIGKNFVIISIGMGKLMNQPCGKSYLLNNFFYTKFQLSEEKHELCTGVPEIALNIYKNENMPVSVIDISSSNDSSQALSKNLVKYSHILLIHALKEDEGQITNFLNEYKGPGLKLILFRDSKDYDGIAKIESSIMNQEKKMKCVFDLPNLTKVEFQTELNFIKQFIHKRIFEQFAISHENGQLSLFNRYFQTYDQNLEILFDKLMEADSNCLIFTKLFELERTIQREKLKYAQDSNEWQVLDENYKRIQSDLRDTKLDPILVEFLIYLNNLADDHNKIWLVLSKFADLLRSMRLKKSKNYYALYNFKSKNSQKLSPSDVKEFNICWERIKSNKYFLELIPNNTDQLNSQQIAKLIPLLIEIVETKIIPEILSIELFWRELIYMSEYNPNFSIASGDIPLKDIVIKLKKIDILNGGTFELIDGDSLYMPKHFYEKVLEQKDEEVAVISVLGPQSSGKSTLLNFLFGCDFLTSSGRCTKGIYGNYIEISNFNHYKGILILDTEGLFSILNKKDGGLRHMFDRKLVLFCLMISDIVIINTKGDIGREMMEVLEVCAKKFCDASKGKIQIPEIFLVLNQNNDTNRHNQIQDINNICDQLNRIFEKDLLNKTQNNEKKTNVLAPKTQIYLGKFAEIQKKILNTQKQLNLPNKSKTINCDSIEISVNSNKNNKAYFKDTHQSKGISNQEQAKKPQTKSATFCEKLTKCFTKKNDNLSKNVNTNHTIITKTNNYLSFTKSDNEEIAHEHSNIRNLNQNNNLLLAPQQQLVINEHSIREEEEKSVLINEEDNFFDIGNTDDNHHQLIISPDNAMILPNAFDIKIISSKEIHILQDPISKFGARPEFYQDCNKLCSKIFQALAKRSSANSGKAKNKTLSEVLDHINQIWCILDEFSDLVKYENIEKENQEQAMQKYVIKMIADVKSDIETQLLNFLIIIKDLPLLTDLKKEFNYLNLIKKLKHNCLSEFDKEFQEKQSFDDILFNDNKRNLESQLDRVFYETELNLKTLEEDRRSKYSMIQGYEEIYKAAVQAKGKSPIEQQAIFGQIWNLMIEKANQPLNRKKNAESLIKMIKDNFNTCIKSFKQFLPDLIFPLDYEKPLWEYKNLLIDKFLEKWNIESFIYARIKPTMVFENGKFNLKYKYFDIRKYFDEIKTSEYTIIEKSQFLKCIDFDKLNYDIKNNLSYKELENNIYLHSLNELNDQINIRNFQIHYIDFRQWLQNANPKYGEDRLIRKEFLQYYISLAPHISRDHLYRKILSECINWYYLSERIKYVLLENIKYHEVYNLFIDNLEQLNLKCSMKHTDFLTFLHEPKNKEKLKLLNLSNSNNLKNIDLDSLQLKYIKNNFKKLCEKKLEDELNEINKNYYIINRENKTIQALKKDYQNIEWLKSYGRKEYDKIYSKNSSQDRALLILVYSGFDIRKLLDDIFEAIINILDGKTNYMSSDLMIATYSAINDKISEACDDLQQVSYNISPFTESYIYLFGVHIIWKFFEEASWEDATKPLRELKNNREAQYAYFLSIASADDEIKNQKAAENLVKQLEEQIEKLFNQEKNKIENDLVKDFQKKVTRKSIQNTIDQIYFSPNRNITFDNLIQYIETPEKLIKDEIEKISVQYLNDLMFRVKQEAILPIIEAIKDLKSRIDSYKTKVSDVWTENTYLQDYLIVDNLEGQNDSCSTEVFFQKYAEELAKPFFELLIKRLLGDNTFQADIDIKLNRQSNYKVKIKPELIMIRCQTSTNSKCQILLKELLNNGIRVYNLSIFLKFFSLNVSNILTSKESHLENLFEKQKHQFKEKITKEICTKRCPCCERICGVDGLEHKPHRCLYGHQIRAFGGVMMNNGEASVLRCEDISDTDMIKYRGRDMSWFEFKNEWQNHPKNPWKFDDLNNHANGEEFKRNLLNLWQAFGQDLCDRYNNKNPNQEPKMKYVPHNTVNYENQKLALQVFHYIFAIDSSASMHGRKWKTLLKDLRSILGSISKKNLLNRATIINFSTNCQIEFDACDPSKIDVDSIKFFNSGTNFTKPLQMALKTMKDFQKIAKDIRLIFMSDGEAGEPINEIDEIKNFINSPEFKTKNCSFQSFWLPIETKSSVMESMCDKLGGKLEFVEDIKYLHTKLYEVLNNDK